MPTTPDPSQNPAPTGTGTTTGSYQSLPTWYDQLSHQYGTAVSGALSNVNQLGNNWYDKPLVQGWDQMQNQAYNQAGSAATSGNPQFQAGWNTMQPASGYLSNQGAQAAGQIGSGLQTGQNTLNQAAQGMQGALSSMSGTGQFDPNALQQFYNPYTSNVMDEIARRGYRDLTEKALPAVNASFTGAGQFGGSRNQEFAARALRDAQQNVLSAQGIAANQAMNQAQQNQLAWNQAAQNAATGQAGIAAQQAGLGVNQANLPANIYGQQLGAYNTLGSGLSALGAQQGSYGNLLNQNAWQNLQNQMNVGAQKQAQGQKELDTAYQDWQTQLSTPINMMGALSQMVPNFSKLYSGNQTQVQNSNAAPSSTQDAILAAILAAINAKG